MKRVLGILIAVVLVCPMVLADFAAGEKAYNDRDFATAWKELFPLAQKGDPRAMEAVGCMYIDGNGVKEDRKAAMEWFTKAVDLGYLDAWNNIGFLYTEGLGVPKNPVKAFECYLKAAKNNNFMAQSTVAALYYGGIGVEQSPEKALKWFLISAENPETEPDIQAVSKAKVEELTGLLSPEVVANAREQARLYKKWIEKKPIDITKISD